MAFAAGLLLLGACAADTERAGPGDPIPDGYPTVASADFDDTFEITAATIGGGVIDFDDASVRSAEFDVVTGAATIDIGCDRRLGSFTLAADQRASVTLTGRIEVDPCQLSDIDDALWALIEQVDRWESTDSGFRLIAPGGDNLTLTAT